MDALAKQHGYQTYIGGGSHGKPDLAGKNYNTGHLMIYDPGDSAASFHEQQYTSTWRKIHELAHALTYDKVNKIYGEGRRIGKLGVHRTPREAMRAVHWEYFAVHQQRELSKQIGVHISDHDFNRELNINQADAVHRAVHGLFTEPGDEHFHPHSTKPSLGLGLNLIKQHAAALGLKHHDALLPRR